MTCKVNYFYAQISVKFWLMNSKINNKLIKLGYFLKKYYQITTYNLVYIVTNLKKYTHYNLPNWPFLTINMKKDMMINAYICGSFANHIVGASDPVIHGWFNSFLWNIHCS